MKVAILSPVAWRTPPRAYGPWELFCAMLTDGLHQQGIDVTLFATADSETSATLESVVAKGWEEDPQAEPKVLEALHIGNFFEQADKFDLLHNNFDFFPLSYTPLIRTPMVTTIHGFSSPKIIPVYQRHNPRNYYVAISESDRAAELNYQATIHHGIPIAEFKFQATPDDYLVFFGRIHHDKGLKEAIAIARASHMPLKIAGIIQDRAYYDEVLAPVLAADDIEFLGAVGPDQRSAVLGGAKALLHPINFDEPFGFSVIEAMACGTPVIANNRGSMPELILHEKTGFLVSNVDSAVEAVHQTRHIDRTRCRSHTKENFSLESMVSKYISVYKDVLLTHPRER